MKSLEKDGGGYLKKEEIKSVCFLNCITRLMKFVTAVLKPSVEEAFETSAVRVHVFVYSKNH